MEQPELIRVAVVGAAGRMGQEVLRALTPAEGFEVVLAVDRQNAGANCRDLAGPKAPDILIEDKLGAGLDRTQPQVLVDFSNHSAAAQNAESALKRKVSPVIGATGMTDSDLREIRQLTTDYGTPAMYVPNFAIGAVLMMKFAQLAAKWMPDSEIIELHHEKKEDAPSGTAMLTAELIAEARTGQLAKKPIPHIKVEGARGGKYRDTPIHSVRLPGLLAHQEVIFGGPGESLTIRHDSLDRISFMHGVRLCAREVLGMQGLTIGLDKILFR